MLKQPKTNQLKSKGASARTEKSVNKNIAAVINIGSNSLRLKIAEKVKDEIKALEELRYPLSLGEDTFTVGMIEPDTVNRLCAVLSNFTEVIKQYDIPGVRTIATTALREAANKDYIVDIIKTRTGLSVDVLNDADEKSYIYNEVTKLFTKYEADMEDCLISYIGVGNLGVAYYERGRFPFMHSLRLGSLRLSELFENVLDYGENYFEVVEEYQSSVIEDLAILTPDKRPLHFAACGSEVMFISELCGAERQGNINYIAKESFLRRYEKIKGKTHGQIMDDYGINERRAELVFPFMSMCATLLSLTDADKIIMPLVNLRDAVLYEQLYQKKSAEGRESFNENIIAGAETLAQRYGADLCHGKLVMVFASKIFDRLKKQNGFSKKDALFLKAAAIMHDTGKFINIKKHDDHAYSIISGSDISGLNPEETEFVACICKYNGKSPQETDAVYGRLPTKKKVLVSKLAAILGIAEALDRSHTGKFSDIEVTLSDNVMTVTVSAYKDTLLEEWAFKKRTAVFERVFGIKAVFRRRKPLL